MPACNFKARFARKVATGEKRTTIRQGQRFKVGDRFMGYIGMRTKSCLRLVTGKVVHADVLGIDRDEVIEVNETRLLAGAATALALGDGFLSRKEFVAFFAETYGLPFVGQLVQWEPDGRSFEESKKLHAALNKALGGTA